MQSDYLESRFGDTFSYIDNMLNQFFQGHVLADSLDEATAALDHSYEAKLAVKVTDHLVRRQISQDYTTRDRVVADDGTYRKAVDADPEEERLTWMECEFSKQDLFDPAQMNLVILNSGLTYQYLQELKARKTGQDQDTFFSYAASRYVEESQGANVQRDMPVFPFIASFLSPQNGFILKLNNAVDKDEHQKLDLTLQKIKLLDQDAPVRALDPRLHMKEALRTLVANP